MCPFLQADEIRAMVGGKERPHVGIFAAIDVWSRLWPATVVGKTELSQHAYLVSRTVHWDHGNPPPPDRYGRIQVLSASCLATLWGGLPVRSGRQQAKERSRGSSTTESRVWTSVEMGTSLEELRGFQKAQHILHSYIERLNLTIRQGSSYLCRRALSHARQQQRLQDHLKLLRCHYNFLRPHRALKFGREVRTPAIQANLTPKRLTFRDIFTSIVTLCVW